ncbi:MAG TPA: HlyD family efflux transporter periplasmic adaptor subunit [Bacteroidales bacterium]|nr:HlyD family efflux transporter periplasmic adaptor subunit [Bacteroidales bacterium]
MKKPLIITASIFAAAFLALFIFNQISSRKVSDDYFTEVKKGSFEISVTSAGELMAENSIDITGPEMAAGRDIRSTRIEIKDLVPEGTIVRKGDFIAQLDRTELSNMLKDGQERLTTMKQTLEVRLLDTAVQLNGLRDQIKNQEFTVAEREMTLKNSKFEPPTVIRQAEINVEQAKRVLDQVKRNYTRRVAQMNTDIYNQRYWINMVEKRVRDAEEVLAGFTVKAPADGMVIYKKEWRGNKRKAGSFIDPRDRVVATLPDLTTMLSKIYVSEIDINKVKKGQEVEITVDAFPTKAYKGTVTYMANIGEKLPNTSEKMFEVQIRLAGTDPNLRPSMTTGNKIIITEYNDAIYLPIECIQAGVDSIPFVFRKNGTRQVVVTGEANDKNMLIEKGLEPGTLVYLANPENPDKFRLTGEELIPVIKEREKQKRSLSNTQALLQGAN